MLHNLESIIKVLENEKDILFAYLFGSYAKGTQNEDPLYPSRITIRIENILDENNVDLRILNGSTLRFRNQVLMHGKLLHSKDEKKRIEFETSSLAQYYDFKPHIDRYDAARRARLGI